MQFSIQVGGNVTSLLFIGTFWKHGFNLIVVQKSLFFVSDSPIGIWKSTDPNNSLSVFPVKGAVRMSWLKAGGSPELDMTKFDHLFGHLNFGANKPTRNAEKNP